MPRKPPKPTRRQRAHGLLPPGFSWRDGKPIWSPSPARRAQGWRAMMLKDTRGAWLAKGAAIERAQAIADAVQAWVAGAPAPWDLAAIAPKDATEHGATAAALNPRGIGTLLDAYYAGDHFTALGDKTQSDYRSKLNRFLGVLGGGADKTGAVRALPIDELLPPGFNEEGEFELERAYELLRDEAGEAMANGVMACVSAWLAWCVKKKRVWRSNPALLVDRETLDGRIVVFEWPEIVALVRTADALGFASIADAIVLAVDLSWSQQDLLALTWGQVSADGHIKHRRIKTGNAGNPRLLSLGRARLDMIRARLPARTVETLRDVRQDPILVCELTGRAWVPDTFRHTFAEIRAIVAKGLPYIMPAALPDVAFKQFRDLRDTSITYCQEAGLDIAGICSRTQHSLDRAQAVIAKHYGAVRQGHADDAADKLDAHFTKMGYTLEAPPLALPAPKASKDSQVFARAFRRPKRPVDFTPRNGPKPPAAARSEIQQSIDLIE